MREDSDPIRVELPQARSTSLWAGTPPAEPGAAPRTC